MLNSGWTVWLTVNCTSTLRTAIYPKLLTQFVSSATFLQNNLIYLFVQICVSEICCRAWGEGNKIFAFRKQFHSVLRLQKESHITSCLAKSMAEDLHSVHQLAAGCHFIFWRFWNHTIKSRIQCFGMSYVLFNISSLMPEYILSRQIFLPSKLYIFLQFAIILTLVL
jgi:hypothetical protein